MSRPFSNPKKENVNYSNIKAYVNVKTRLLIQSEYQQAHQEQNYQMQVITIRRQILKASMKRFICNALNQRKKVDQEESYLSVANDHRKYTVFRQWKQITKELNAKKAQAQFTIEEQKFKRLRAIFKQWNSLVRTKKRAQAHFLRRVFTNLKTVCTSQLLVRLKRIQLSSLLHAKYSTQMFQRLRRTYFQGQIQNRKASSHYTWNLKNKYFQGFASHIHILRKDNMRYRQYKMAVLFHKKAIYKKCFKALSVLLRNKSKLSGQHNFNA